LQVPQLAVVEKSDPVCMGKMPCCQGVAAVSHYDAMACLLVSLSGRNFLDSFVAHRPSVKFTLNHNFHVILFGHDVYALVATSHRDPRGPSGSP